jgi:glutamate carboxypeptidase
MVCSSREESAMSEHRDTSPASGADRDAPALARAAAAHLQSALPDYLHDLAALVTLESGSYDRDGVQRVGDAIRRRTGAWGAALDVNPGGEYGDSFALALPGRGSASVALLCHMDTVFERGEVAENPFRIEESVKGTRARGPGVCDMKAGIVSAIYAVDVLRALGFDDFKRLTLVCTADEEIGAPSSRDFIERVATGANAVLVLEAGRENGDIVGQRKVSGFFQLAVTGIPAHAGVEPEKGRSAILTLARQTVALHALNDYPAGKTVNVGEIKGGTRPNVVPERASAGVDLRARTERDFEELLAAVKAALGANLIEGTSYEWTAPPRSRPAWGPNAGTDALAARAQVIAAALGFSVTAAATGGTSDGNFTAALGVPTLDGLAPVGGLDHSRDEYVDIASIVPRTAMLAGLIASICLG